MVLSKKRHCDQEASNCQQWGEDAVILKWATWKNINGLELAAGLKEGTSSNSWT